MTADIVLPSLTQWTKNHVTALLQAVPSMAEYDALLDKFLARDAEIIVNGVTVERSALAGKLQGEKVAEAAAQVTFVGDVEVPADSENPSALAGSVGLFYIAVIADAFLVRDTSIEFQLTASLNVVIKEDPSLPPPPSLPIRGFSDHRRVFVLSLVTKEGQVSSADPEAA